MFATLSAVRYLETVSVPVDEPLNYPGNARVHDEDWLDRTVKPGQHQSILVRRLPNGKLQILGGHGTRNALRRRGDATVRCEVMECTDEEALQANLSLNPPPGIGSFNEGLLAELLERAKEYDILDVTGWGNEDLQNMLLEEQAKDADKELDDAGDDAEQLPSPRQLPIDAILTLKGVTHVAMLIAHSAGFKVGTQSSATTVLTKRERWEWRYPLTFIDNEWHDYDHKRHLEFVAAFRPKYATTRDIMTKQQCKDAGVEYYTIPQVLEMAEEIGQHAENVILIPKYDCLDELPEKYVMGYSVRSSYGATPLPAEMFRGRRVHLLGGSWKYQLRYLRLLGEDVVSLDFNHCLKQSEFASFTRSDGSQGSLGDHFTTRFSNPGTIAMALSLGNIGWAIHEITQGKQFGNADVVISGDEEPLDIEEDAR